MSACGPSAACRTPSRRTTVQQAWGRHSGRQDGCSGLLAMRGANSAVKVVWLGLVPNSAGQ
eukprot:8210826-Heterocapsa_arctica.AAC.1